MDPEIWQKGPGACPKCGMALGLAMAVVVEEWGLTQGRWVYRPEMPTVPGTPLGVVPLVQMGVLTPLIVWMADRFTGRAG